MSRQTLSLQLAAMKRLTAQKYDIILSGLNTNAIATWNSLEFCLKLKNIFPRGKIIYYFSLGCKNISPIFPSAPGQCRPAVPIQSRHLIFCSLGSRSSALKSASKPPPPSSNRLSARTGGVAAGELQRREDRMSQKTATPTKPEPRFLLSQSVSLLIIVWR